MRQRADRTYGTGSMNGREMSRLPVPVLADRIDVERACQLPWLTHEDERRASWSTCARGVIIKKLVQIENSPLQVMEVSWKFHEHL